MRYFVLLFAVLFASCASIPSHISDVQAHTQYQIQNGVWADCTMEVLTVRTVKDELHYDWTIQEEVCGAITCDEPQLYVIKCLPFDVFQIKLFPQALWLTRHRLVYLESDFPYS